MFEWYERAIIHPGRQPMLLALIAFVATFIVTRTITRLIRSGRGPFGNVKAGDVHIHHVVPGVVSILVGGIIMLSSPRLGLWFAIGAIIFGVGAALVLDEFALILHLDDVYWKREGRLSIDAITIALAVMAVTLYAFQPDNPPGPPQTDPHVKVLGPVLFFLFWALPVIVTVLKGKLFTAALGVVTPVFAWVGAWRLAKPGSPFAQLRYSDRPRKLERAREREAQYLASTAPMRRWWGRILFGFDEAEFERREAEHRAGDPDAPAVGGVDAGREAESGPEIAPTLTGQEGEPTGGRLER